jgi:hypothetical protein
LKKNYFSSHKLPKQQSTSFWFQGILGVKKKQGLDQTKTQILDTRGLLGFFLLVKYCQRLVR